MGTGMSGRELRASMLGMYVPKDGKKYIADLKKVMRFLPQISSLCKHKLLHQQSTPLVTLVILVAILPFLAPSLDSPPPLPLLFLLLVPVEARRFPFPPRTLRRIRLDARIMQAAKGDDYCVFLA